MASKILYVSQEIAPYLPDTECSKLVRALTQAMQERGNEIRTFMPRYGCINERRHQLHEVIRLSGMNLIIDDNDHQLIIKVASIPAARVQIYFIDNDDYFARKAVLTDAEGHWFADNDERAIFFARGVLETVKKLLPDDHAIYLYSYPRISTKGVTYFYNEYESASRRAYTEEYLLTFEQLSDVLNRNSACYKALMTSYSPKVSAAATGYSDVSSTCWALQYINTVTERKLMTGANGKFRPNDKITAAEVCTTIARQRGLSGSGALPAGVRAGEWYSDAVSAVYANGLLEGLSDNFRPTAAMTREDAMQLFANLLQADGTAAMSDAETAQTLASVKDAGSISADRRNAVALCMQKGLVQGFSDGTIKPQGTFTRAEFAKLLTTI